MAYVPDTTTTDPNAPVQGNQTPNTPQNLPPATSSVGAGSGGSGQGVAAQPGANKQAPVQNLSEYLVANQPQELQAGQNIANNLTATANKVSGDISADQSAIDQQVQASNVKPNADLVNQAASDPTNFVTNPQNLADFLAQENANYTGPSSAESTSGWENLTTEVQNALQTAQTIPDLSNPAGYLQLASSQETNPTAGMTNLDAALLEETPGVIAPIAAAKAPLQALSGQQTAAATAEDAAIQQATQNDAAASGLIAPAFTTGPNAVVPAWEKGLQNTLATDTAQTQAYDQAVNSLIGQENAAQPDVAALQNALSSYNSFAPTYSNTDPFLAGTSSTLPTINGVTLAENNPTALNAPTLDQVASSHDVAEQNALEELLGKGFSPYISDTTQAGMYQSPGAAPTLKSVLSGDLSTLGTDLTGANNAYTSNGALAPAGTPANSILTGSFGNARATGDIPVGYSLVGVGNNSRGQLSPAVQKAIKDGTAINVGLDKAGNDYYAIPGDLVPGQPESSVGNQGLVNTGAGVSSPAHPLPMTIGKSTYSTAPAQYTDLQNAYSALEQYLAAQGA